LLVVSISVPREIDAKELLPPNAHPFGATPHHAPKEYRVECRDRAEADMLVNTMRNQPGIRAMILE
jgi:hypothetical protein